MEVVKSYAFIIKDYGKLKKLLQNFMVCGIV